MSADLTVRPAQLSDADDLVRLLELMHDGVRETPASDREVELLDEILRQRNRQLFVAVTGGQAVGTVDVVVVTNLSRGGSPWAVVENLVVDPSRRRAGIGRALMTATLEFAEGSGCYKIQLVSNTARDSAQKLYRSLGFSASVNGFRRYLKAVAVL